MPFYPGPPAFIGGAQPLAPHTVFSPPSVFFAGLLDLVASNDTYPGLAYGMRQTDSAAVSETLYSSSVSIFDTVAAGDGYSVTDFGRFTADTATSGESLTANVLAASAAVPAESAVSSDNYATPGVWLAAQVANAVSSDAFVQTAIALLLTDNATGDDTLTKTALSASLPTDTYLTSDTYVQGAVGYLGSLSDSAVSSGPFTQTSFYAGLADFVGGGESLGSSFSTAYNPFTGDFSADFGSGPGGAGAQASNDTLPSVDVFSGALGIVLTGVADSAVSGDFYAYPVSAVLSDSVSSGDVLAGAGSDAVSVSDTAASGDGYPAFATLLPVGLSESAAASDLLSGALGFTAGLSDTAASGETVSPVPVATSATLNETAATGDSLTSSLFTLTVALADAVATASTPALAAFTTGLSDIAASAENLGNLANAPTGQSDSATGTDLLTLVPVSANLTDTGVSTESLSGVLALAGTIPLTDAAAATDAIAAAADVVPSALTDSAAATDPGFSATAATSAALADFAAATDVLSSLFGSGAFGTNLADFNPVTDSLTLPAGFTPAAALADPVVGSDAVIKTLLLFFIGDTAASGDTLGAAFGFTLSVADTAASDDAPTATTAAVAGPGSDTVASADTLTAAAAAALPLADTAVSGELYSSPAYFGALTETTGATDTLTGAGNAPFTLTDSAAATDTPSLLASSYGVFDTVVTTDAIAGPVAATAALTADSAAGGDTLDGSLGFAGPAFGDSLPVSDILATGLSGTTTVFGGSTSSNDTLSATAIIAADLPDFSITADTLVPTAASTGFTDTATSVDTLIGQALVAASLADSAASGDTLSLGNIIFAGLSDSNSTTDGLAILASSLTLSDAAASDDALTVIAGLAAALADSPASSDAYGSVKGFPAVLADILGDSDAFPLPGFGYRSELSDSLFGSDFWPLPGISTLASVVAAAVPTGGAVLLQFPGYFPPPLIPTILTIRRSVTGSSAQVLIYEGPPVGAFLDVGDSLPQPLDGATAYIWQVSDGITSVMVGPLTPVSTFINEPDQLTQVLIRALQGAINTMVLPPGVQPAVVTLKMPMNGWQAMPFIVVNLDLIQQTDTEIGEDFPAPNPANIWTLFANAKRVWRVTVISQAAEERDFYRDSLLAVFRILKATAFAPLGFDVSHTFSATSYSSTSEWEGLNPGFYGADLMLEVNGIFPAAVLTNYPVILEVAANPTFDPNSFIEQVLP